MTMILTLKNDLTTDVDLFLDSGHEVSEMPVQTEKYDYIDLVPKVKAALRRAFPDNSTIVTSQGYNGRVHGKVVSERFDGITERDKQAIIWDALRDELKEEAQAVSIALAYGTDKL